MISDLETYKKWCKTQRKTVGTQEWIDTEIRATIQHALGQKNNDIDSAIMQVTCLRLAYNLEHGKCVASILRSIIESTCSETFRDLKTIRSKIPNLISELNKILEMWSPYIIKISRKNIEENVRITEYLDTYCRYRFYGYPILYKYFFPCLLHRLYMYDIIEEDGLFTWRDITEESVSESTSSGGSAADVMEQIKHSMVALDATEKLFIWLDESDGSDGSSESNSDGSNSEE